MKYNIYSIPNEVSGLEYLNLLYKHLMGRSEDGNIFELKKFSWSILFQRFPEGERNIIHSHWETNIYGSKYILVSLIRMAWRFPALILFRMQGFKILWTMHNLKAHDYPHPWIDKIGKRIMWKLANKIIIQEKLVAEKETKTRKTSKIICIPQGNYVGVYGPMWEGNRIDLRLVYGLREEEVVLLALGSIRPYKELPPLIEVVNKIYNEGYKIKLIIMGKLSEDYRDIVESKTTGLNSVLLIPRFVEDSKIPEVLALADYTIFYYDESSLSSAAMIMSLSYGTPVITRDVPASGMIRENVNGHIFHSKSELEEILKKISSGEVFNKSDIIRTVEDQSWPNVTSKLREAYISLWK